MNYLLGFVPLPNLRERGWFEGGEGDCFSQKMGPQRKILVRWKNINTSCNNGEGVKKGKYCYNS